MAAGNHVTTTKEKGTRNLKGREGWCMGGLREGGGGDGVTIMQKVTEKS